MSAAAEITRAIGDDRRGVDHQGVFPHGGEQGWGRAAFVRDAAMAMVAPEIAHGVGAGAR